MTTFVGTIDHLIEFLQQLKEEGYKYAVYTNDLNGQAVAPSNKNKYFRLPFAFSEKAFNKKDLLIFFDNPRIAILLLKDDDCLSDLAKKLIKEADA